LLQPNPLVRARHNIEAVTVPARQFLSEIVELGDVRVQKHITLSLLACILGRFFIGSQILWREPLASGPVAFTNEASEMSDMKALMISATVLMLFAYGAQAQAAGCVSGAAVGGVAGHLAGHHAVLGAAAGCAIGHHEANKQAKAANAANGNSAPAHTTQQTQ